LEWEKITFAMDEATQRFSPAKRRFLGSDNNKVENTKGLMIAQGGAGGFVVFRTEMSRRGGEW